MSSIIRASEMTGRNEVKPDSGGITHFQYCVFIFAFGSVARGSARCCAHLSLWKTRTQTDPSCSLPFTCHL